VVMSRNLRVLCGSWGLLLAVGISGSSRSFINGYSFFFVSGTDMLFMTCSATSRPQPTTSGQLREECQRRYTINAV
jgi:hypothetical protein